MRLSPPADFDLDAFYESVVLFQSWDIFPGFRTPGIKPVEATLNKLAFPDRLDGLRVLDIGPWNGFFSFECARRGAREVVSLGPEDPDVTGYAKSAALLELECVRYVRDSLYSIPKLSLGAFDLILFLGVIYHLRHPLLALDILHDLHAEFVFIDTPVVDSMGQVLLPPAARERIGPSWREVQSIPLVYFSHLDETAHDRDACNWFIPNGRALQDWINSSGFVVEAFIGEPTWAFAKARRIPRTFEPGLEGFSPSETGARKREAMKQEIADQLAGLPGLESQNLWKDAVPCKICGGTATFFDVVDFNKHCSQGDTYSFGPSDVHVVYRRCTCCSFIFTNFFDDWTPEEFSRFVYNSDYIKVDPEYVSVRPTAVARAMAELLTGCETARILDYGSGTGVFAEHMEAAGFTKVENYDPFSSPDRPSGRFDIVTCFEVIEHTPSPLAALMEMKSFLAEGGCIVFSQTLQPEDIRQMRGSWWYLAPRNGHMSAFTAGSLAVLADKAGLIFHRGTGPYAFSLPPASELASRALATMGLPFFARVLCAPGPGTRMDSSGHPTDERWHSIEPFPRGSFRWTRATTVTWRIADLPTYPCMLRVRIPVLHEIRAGFAGCSTVGIRGRTVPSMRDGQDLVAEIVLEEAGPTEVMLTTPAPTSSVELRDASDVRRLGLAILTETSLAFHGD